jgi:hypothetical protein
VRPDGRRWTDLAWRAYEGAPARADALFEFGRRYVLPLARYAVPLRRLRGRAVADGRPGSVLVAGSGVQLPYFGRRLFDGEVRAEALGACQVHALPGKLLALGGGDDLIMARVARPLAALFFDACFLPVPDMVDVWLDLRDPADVVRRMDRKAQRMVRMLRAGDHSWSDAHEPAAFERFYNRYYLPSAAARHGDLAAVRERPILRRHFRRGGVLWVRKGGEEEEAAGLLYCVDGRAASLPAAGTRGGDLAARRQGALDAAKLFAIELALDRGLDWVNLGGCMPSPRDGSLANKRAWGGVLRERRGSHHDLLLRWPRFTPRVARFLADAPVFVREPAGLAALAAVPTGEPHLASRLWRHWRMPGLERLHVVAPDCWRAWRREDAPPPPAGRLRLCAAGAAEDVLASTQDAACLAREAG